MKASASCVSLSMLAAAQAASDDPQMTRGPLEEVIVTAQKREQRLEEVPISISVLDGQFLDKYTTEGVSEALARVPGVATFTAVQGGGTQLSVRGVTAAGPLFFGSSPIAYYLDSIPFGFVKTAIAPDANTYDLERVEVLRGPQGTLYGASALNGVIRVLTADADPSAFALKARTLLSTTEDGGENYRGDMAVNVPIVPGKLAARAVVGYQDLGGWIDRPTRTDANDGEVLSARLKVNARPSDQLSVGATAWISRSDYGAPSSSADGLTSPFMLDESMTTDYDVYGLTIGYDFGPFLLTSNTSYIDYRSDSALDYAGAFNLADTRLVTGLDARTFSQEVLLQSAAEGAWRWSFGGIYRDGEDRLFQFRRQYAAPTRQANLSESYAVFGELTRVFADGRFELTGGLRYFEDNVKGEEFSRLTGATALINTDSTFDAVSPRVVLTWHPSKGSTVYASFSEGFRSGFDQNPGTLAAAPNLPSVDADVLKNYEVGAKAVSPSGRFMVDAAVFYTDWEDVQQSLTINVGTLAAPIPLAALVNGESASGMGVDFAVTVEPVDGLQFGINVGWNDLAMDSDVLSGSAVLFRKGDRPNYSAEYIAGAMFDYAFGLGGSDLKARFSASANYVSEQEGRTLTGTLVTIGQSDELLVGRTSFGIESPDRWTATLFIDNVSNEDGAVQRSPLLVANWATRLRPRTMGVQLDYRFR